MPRSADNLDAKIADATLRLAGKKGWDALDFDVISKAAKIPASQLCGQFRDKNAMLPAIVKFIDQRTAKALGKPDKRASPRDRLFEVLMARFDILQEYREGIVAILNNGIKNPAIGRYLLPAHCNSMRQILAASGISMPGSEKKLITAGFLAVYYRTICYWKKDSSPDMNRTMAVLDQGLRFACKAAELLFRGR
jgi:ubiquinone biosynthesis protein COQ9